MKFQFCGNLSAAEWFLAESSILSKITSIKLKMVVGHLCKHVIEGINNSEKVYSLLENSGFAREEISTIIACLNYILTNSIKYEATDSSLLKDLIDLGLPKENCESITRVYKENMEKMKEKQLSKVLKIGKLEKFDFGVCEILASKRLRSTKEYQTKYADISLQIKNKESNNETDNIRFSISKDKALSLITEIRKAQEIMEKLS